MRKRIQFIKKRISFIVLLLCLAGYAQAQQARVVDKPPFAVWNTPTFEVEKIQLADTATVLSINGIGYPGEQIRIAAGTVLKDNTGKVYPVRFGVGIVPGGTITIPESYIAPFQLVFPPLPPDVTTVDFLEPEDVSGGVRIWGIRLDESPVPAPAIRKETMKGALPEPVLKRGMAVVKGRLLDYIPGSVTEVKVSLASTMYINNALELRVNEDGTFRAEIELLTVAPAYVQLSFEYFPTIKCLLAPGEEITLLINTSECCRRQSRLHKDEEPYGPLVFFGGYLAGLQQELLDNAQLQNVKMEEIYKDIEGMTVDQYGDYLMKLYSEKVASYQALPVSDACKEMLTMSWGCNTILLAQNPRGMIQEAYCVNHQLNDAQAREYRDNNIPIISLSYNNDLLKRFSFINSMKALYCNGCFEVTLKYMRDPKEAAKQLGADKGVFFDLLTVSRCWNQFSTFKPLTPEHKQALSECSLPALAEWMNEKNMELQKWIEENKTKKEYTIRELGDVNDDELLPAIVGKYRGKVVLLDFWATWCGPCRQGHKEMAPMKEAWKNKDIVYVYLTNQTSPMEAWENMIPEISGEHIRLTDSQWQYVWKHFGMRGIPVYVFIDKEGNVAHKELGYPGLARIKSVLLKYL